MIVFTTLYASDLFGTSGAISSSNIRGRVTKFAFAISFISASK
jgi:hypothetical protein